MESTTLQKLCVKTIAINFENYRLKCKSRHFLAAMKLIEKLYSDQILEILFKKKALKNEHLKFLINKYTKQLNLQYLLNCDFDAIEERLYDIGHVITVFYMPGVKRVCENLLRHLTKVQVLDLSRSSCSDCMLSVISENCCELKELYMAGCERVTDKGLFYLCEKKLPLQNLNLENTSVSYKGVALILKCMPLLEKLWCNNVPRAICEASGLNDLDDVNSENMYQLHNITILNNPLRPKNHLISIMRLCAMSCPMIRDLIVSEIVSREQLDLCCTFNDLENVSLQCSRIVNLELSIDNFLKLRGEKLRSLTLVSFSINVELLAQCCPNLESLCLQYPTFQNGTEKNCGFPHLIRLNFQDASLDLSENWSPASIVSSSPLLKELHLVHCEISDQMKDVLLHSDLHIKFLNLSNTFISYDFVEDMLRVHTGLEELVINNSGIQSDEYDDLLDMVDDLDRKVNIVWADYTEAIRELFYSDYDSVFNDPSKRMILKL